jgi:hypothetical protein
MELKTLKDFEKNRDDEPENNGYGSCMYDLRQEAIKWIKYLRTSKNDRMESKAVVQFIIHFFNITESELKPQSFLEREKQLEEEYKEELK